MIKGAVAVIFDREGRVLLLLRPKKDRWMPSKWALVGGKLDKGETPEQALRREVAEETTLQIKSPIEFYTSKNGEVIYFIVKSYDGNVCIDYEHDDFAWVYPEELTNYDVVPGLIARVWRAREMLVYYA
jgi:8-oxo-dGTP diphosphatase